MPIIDELLSKLNEEQIKPVLDTDGAVLVIAGAGSGKTRVLTSRIAYLVLSKGVSPSDIMAITFTNKAADEMKNRLSRFIGDNNDMWVSTIHSMCVKILRADIDKIGYDRRFTIYDETDKDRVLKRVIDELGLESDKILKPAKNWISYAKNECLSPEQLKKEQGHIHIIDDVCKIYEFYDFLLARSNALDFDDLLYKTYQLFSQFPDVADYYSRKFKYIHVDEFQDTNKVQFAIIQRISIANGNIFVVGDDDQSIYGWRGAKIENILHFDDIYRGAKVYKLERNYRSSKKILELANCIIANNTMRRKKTLWTDNGDGAKIEKYVAENENHEASYVAIQIKSLMNRNSNLKYKDFAVFMRINALSRAIESEFTKYGLPYKVYGGFRFYERKEIKDVLSYLKVINNPKDDEQFLRCISVPKRGIGEKTLIELKEYASSCGLPIFDAIDKLEFSSLGNSSRAKLVNFKNLLLNFIDFSKNKNIVEILNYVLESTSFMEQFSEDNEENISRKYNISELLNSAEEFIKNNPSFNLADFLNNVTLSSDTDEINNDDAITVATIHAVKGLEFKNVFVVGLDEGVIPLERAKFKADEMEEERRLMYVAITRARERLYLTRALSRFLFGGRSNMVQSTFLNEANAILSPNSVSGNNNIGAQSCLGKSYFGGSIGSFKTENTEKGFSDTASSFGYSSSYAKSLFGGNKPKLNDTGKSILYKTGMKVKHAKFGEGIVVLIKGSGDNTIIDVAFKGVGVKSLSAKFAPLEIL